jgi:hypothetical protein
MPLMFLKNPAARARPNAGSAALTLNPGTSRRVGRRWPDRTAPAPASKGLRRDGRSINVRMLSAYSILRDAFVRGSRLLRGRLLASLLGLGCLNFGIFACATTHFDGQVFRQGDVAFRLEHLPAGWRNIEINDTALAFRDDENASTVAINGRCGKDAEDVPLRSLTQHLFLQFTDRRLEEQELFPLDGREALRTQMVARLDGVQKYFHVVVLKKDGCVYDFLQIANGPQDTERFLHFVRGFSSLS